MDFQGLITCKTVLNKGGPGTIGEATQAELEVAVNSARQQLQCMELIEMGHSQCYSWLVAGSQAWEKASLVLPGGPDYARPFQFCKC